MNLRIVARVALLTALIVPVVHTARAEDPKSKPSVPNRPLLEMVFVLDTTGSMGGLLKGAKQRIWGIVNDMMAVPADRRPEVRVGLVAYRDIGDAYVTKETPLTTDLDKIYSTLMDYRAEGGGDEPENVRRALAEGLSKTGWSNKTTVAANGRKVAQILFLVGDAPPHEDYKQEPDVLATAGQAVSKGIYINAIQCGESASTKEVWQSVARRGEGQYFAVAQDGGVVAVTTPYDAPLAQLGSKIGRTYVAFGGGAGRAGVTYRAMSASKAVALEEKVSVSAGAAPAYTAAAADRAVNKAINSYAYDKADLITAIENNSTTLDKVKAEDLPEDLKKLPTEQRKVTVEKRLTERKQIRSEILALQKKRDAYIAAERKKQMSKSANKTSFDTAVAEALKKQVARRGIRL